MLLVGFMGSGKSTVGPALARALGWRFEDVDEVIVREAGTSVADIFRSRGEGYFREMEARVAARLLHERGVVLAAGGGWAAAPGRLDACPAGTETLWLRVSIDEALRRVAQQPGQRPLLAGDDPRGDAERLLAEREPFYRRARLVVDTDGRSVEDVTGGILRVLAERYPETLHTETE